MTRSNRRLNLIVLALIVALYAAFWIPFLYRPRTDGTADSMAEIPDIPEAACLLQTSGQLAYTIRTDHRYRYFGITGRTTHPDVDRFRADAGLLAPPFVAGAGGVRPPTTIRFAGDDISIPFGGEGDLLIEGHAQGMIRMKMHYLAADGRFYLTFWSSASKRPAEDAPATDHPEQEKE